MLDMQFGSRRSAFQTALDAYNRDIAADYADTLEDCFEEMSDIDIYLVSICAIQTLWLLLKRKNPQSDVLINRLRDIIIQIQFYTGFGLDENLKPTEHGEDEEYLEHMSDRIDTLLRDQLASTTPEEVFQYLLKALRYQAINTHNDTLRSLLKSKML